MPYQCQRCDYLSDGEEKCPKCGSLMTFTILGGLKFEEKKGKTVKVSGEGKPTVWQRIGQVVVGLLWAHLIASLLVTALLFWLNSKGVEPSEVKEKGGLPLEIAKLTIPVVSVAVACVLSLRKVYLAQLVGLVSGLLSGVCLVAEQLFFGIAPQVWHWGLTPTICAAVGFAAGLRVAGKLKVSEEIEYKPVDSWDENVKPKLVYIDLQAPEKWLKVLKAAGFAIVFHGLWFGAYALLRWIDMVGESELRGVFKELNLSRGELISLMLGGMAAAARTKSGLLQGIRFGLVMSIYHWVMTAFFAETLSLDHSIAVAGVFLVLGAVAGCMGSFASPATKHYVNREEPT